MLPPQVETQNDTVGGSSLHFLGSPSISSHLLVSLFPYSSGGPFWILHAPSLLVFTFCLSSYQGGGLLAHSNIYWDFIKILLVNRRKVVNVIKKK